MTENPLTPGAIEVALHDCMPGVAFDRLSATQVMRLAEDMHAALTESRRLTPDAITDEMVERAQHKIQLRATRIPAETIRLALVAALTEPTRPEGAEEIEAWLDGMPESIRLDGDEHQRLFANHLAHMGFRVPVTLAEVGPTEKEN